MKIYNGFGEFDSQDIHAGGRIQIANGDWFEVTTDHTGNVLSDIDEENDEFSVSLHIYGNVEKVSSYLISGIEP